MFSALSMIMTDKTDDPTIVAMASAKSRSLK